MKDCFSVSIILSFYYDNCLKCFSYDTFCMRACVLLLTRLFLCFSLSTSQRTGRSLLSIRSLIFTWLLHFLYRHRTLVIKGKKGERGKGIGEKYKEKNKCYVTATNKFEISQPHFILTQCLHVWSALGF